MFVIVTLSDIDLANTVGLTDAEEIDHHASLDSPVGREVQTGSDASREADFSTEWITEPAERAWGLLEPGEAVHGGEKRREEKAHDPPVETTRKSGAVSLGYLESHLWMHDGICEAHKHVAAVVNDIAIVDSNGDSRGGRQGMSEAKPHVATFSHATWSKAACFEALDDPGNVRAVIPQDGDRARQRSKDFPGKFESGCIRPIEAHHNMVNDARELKLMNNALECW